MKMVIKGKDTFMRLSNSVIRKDIVGLLVDKDEAGEELLNFHFATREEPGMRMFYIFECGLTSMFWIVSTTRRVVSPDVFFVGYFLTVSNLEDIFALDEDGDVLRVVGKEIGKSMEIGIDL